MFKCLSTLNPGDVMAKKYVQSIFSHIQNVFFIEDTIKDIYFGF